MLKAQTYKDCSELPLHNFIKVLVSDDKQHLLTGKGWIYQKPDLGQAWELLFAEFTELSQDNSSNHIFGLIKDITVLRNKIDAIDKCIALLSIVTDLSKFQDTIKALKSMARVYFPFTEETLVNDLVKTKSEVKRFNVDLQVLLKEYGEISGNEQAKATEQDFYDQIVMIEKHNNGITIDPKKTSVLKYVSYLNAIKKEANG